MLGCNSAVHRCPSVSPRRPGPSCSANGFVLVAGPRPTPSINRKRIRFMNGRDDSGWHSGSGRADPWYSINDRLPGKVDSALPPGFTRFAGFYDSAPDSRTGSPTFKRIPSWAFRALLCRYSFRFLTILPYSACVPGLRKRSYCLWNHFCEFIGIASRVAITETIHEP